MFLLIRFVSKGAGLALRSSKWRERLLANRSFFPNTYDLGLFYGLVVW